MPAVNEWIPTFSWVSEKIGNSTVYRGRRDRKREIHSFSPKSSSSAEGKLELPAWES